MEEAQVVLKTIGDEKSSLLDQFERHSFEVRLNQAILGRSFSESGVGRSRRRPPPPCGEPLRPFVTQVGQGCRFGFGFDKFLKKLLKPILGRNIRGDAAKNDTLVPKNLSYWKAGYSRSMRF
ncbi:hypothetical protein Tsubulata_000139 [Turnera subulata]|uniref:Uncharacterized protein n=1 Tax=Turnera subulata TaxID=218843 RepID=A0A9Q0FL25_9ROSI|nr:hypothetical protein Tsubulata_000139 [Turnera subulata]